MKPDGANSDSRIRRRERKSPWRGRRTPIGAGGWLCLCAFAAVIAALAWAGARWLPEGGVAVEPGPVVIDRVMTSNPSVCFRTHGRYYDWLELLNTSDEAVDLKGWRLSDTLDQRSAYAFGDVTLPGRGSLIVYCAPEPEDFAGSEVFCGFRLDSDGELLVLSNERRKLTQVLSVPAMAASDVYQRDGGGDYSVVSFEEMAAAGAVNLTPAFEPNGVMISELMASNRTIVTDGDGEYPDWLELYNGSPTPVALSGCTLSDDDLNQRKWVLPELTLQPGEYRLIFASGKDRREGGELHANFKLSASGETVRLYDPEGNVLSWMEYGAAEPDVSLSRLPDGSLTAELKPTPGFENTEAGARAALTLARENEAGVYINEVMCCGSGLDWLELYNATGKPVDLSGMGLSDSTSRPRHWQFPQGSILPANGYLTVFLTGQGGDSGIVGGRFCADFALSAGETAVLARPDGTLLDRVTLFEQFRNVSYGRAKGHERYRYFADMTPGAANSAKSYLRKAADVTFSQPGGQHSEKELTVELASDGEATIYYTTDGSAPTRKSKVYTGPIALSKNAVIKAVAWQEDVIPSDMTARSFLLNASHTVRIVSVSGDHSKLDSSSGMLNTGVKGTGSGAYVEVYEPDGTQVIGQGCFMKLAGHSSRIDMAQKGFSLRARKQYGPSRFEYPLFSKRDYTWYKSFVMRASGQDSRQTLMRDSILSALAEDTSVMYRETEVCVVYINGRYWGVYNMRERISTEMAAQFEGWDDPDDVEIAQGSGVSNANYRQMLAWVKSHDMSKDANVELLREKMDIENYLEYVALEMYANNQDLNNVGFYCNPKADGKWRWALFDLDLSYQLNGDNVRGWLTGDTVGTITEQTNVFFKRLMKNAKLKDWFLTRMGELLATTFSAENVVGKIKERYDILLPEMKAECKRWNWTIEKWQRSGAAMVRYANARPKKLIGYLADNFDLSDAQTQAYFGEALAKCG